MLSPLSINISGLAVLGRYDTWLPSRACALGEGVAILCCYQMVGAMKIRIHKQESQFVVNPVDKSGSPACGKGRTIDAALADFLRIYQKELGLEIEVDLTAKRAELDRRRRGLNRR